MAIVISSAIICVFKMDTLFGPMHRGDAVLGTLTFTSMICSNYSLRFVNYPFMVLAKSAKVLPVVLIGLVRGVYKFRLDQEVITLAISAGLVIFNLKKMKGL